MVICGAADGTITILDAPGAGTGNLPSTLAFAISAADTVFGVYCDAASLSHGFIYKPASFTGLQQD